MNEQRYVLSQAPSILDLLISLKERHLKSREAEVRDPLDLHQKPGCGKRKSDPPTKFLFFS